MTSLFPDHPEEGFQPKAPEGVLSKYCLNCGRHLEEHGTTWLFAKGSMRTCPQEAINNVERAVVQVEPQPDPDSRSQRRTRPIQPLHSPFGNEYNYDVFNGKVTKGRTQIPQDNHLQGARCESNFNYEKQSVPCQSFNHSHLRGAAVHNIEKPEEKVNLPCRRTNESHLKGAAPHQSLDYVNNNYSRH